MKTQENSIELMEEKRIELMEAVLEQIIDDCRVGDFNAIYELMIRVDEDVLAGFVSEERLMEIQKNEFSG